MYSTITLDKGLLEENADITKMLVLSALVREKLIDKEIADKWCETHTIVFKTKSIFRTITDKWLNEEDLKTKNYYSIVVKKI